MESLHEAIEMKKKRVGHSVLKINQPTSAKDWRNTL